MERYYQIAGICIRVELPEDVKFSGDGPLAAFAVERKPWDQEMVFQVVEELSEPEGELIFSRPGRRIYSTQTGTLRYDATAMDSVSGAITRIHRQDNRRLVQVRRENIPAGLTPAVILNTMEIDQLITCSGGVILHGSFIVYNGEAIVFTAPSGVGKSTQAALWERFLGAEVINGDRVILMPEKDRVIAWGLPFSGSSGICKNRWAPLKAVVYLSQAERNQIRSLKGREGFRCLWEGCNLRRWNDQEVELASDTVMRILRKVPVYHLACRPDAEAVRILEQMLCREVGNNYE